MFELGGGLAPDAAASRRPIPAESVWILPAVRRNAMIAARDHRPPPSCSRPFSLSGPSLRRTRLSAGECASDSIAAHPDFTYWRPLQRLGGLVREPRCCTVGHDGQEFG